MNSYNFSDKLKRFDVGSCFYMLHNMDNMDLRPLVNIDLIYADMIYENLDLRWIGKYWEYLRSGGIFVVQTDWHSLFEVGGYLKYECKDSLFLNHIVWKNEWGNFPKNKFRQSHDDILIFSKGKDYKFYPDRVQVPKVTASSKRLNKSGRDTKLATSIWSDICLTTVAKERVKNPTTGKLIRWQKPLGLMDRIYSAFLDRGDSVLEPFMGSGTGAIQAIEKELCYFGIEYDENVFKIAVERVEEYLK